MVCRIQEAPLPFMLLCFGFLVPLLPQLLPFSWQLFEDCLVIPLKRLIPLQGCSPLPNPSSTRVPQATGCTIFSATREIFRRGILPIYFSLSTIRGLPIAIFYLWTAALDSESIYGRAPSRFLSRKVRVHWGESNRTQAQLLSQKFPTISWIPSLLLLLLPAKIMPTW